MGASLREEMVRLSLFGGKLALAELILFSVFLTDILLLGMMGEINLSGVLLANAAFVLLAVVIVLATSTAVIALRLHLRLRMPRDAA